MNSRIVICCLLASSCVVVSTAAWAGDPDPGSTEPTAVDLPLPAAPERATVQPPEANVAYSLSSDASLCSKYLFQGLDYSGGPVAQPEMVLGCRDFVATAWINFQPGLQELNELDVTIKYQRELKPVTVAAGYNNLRYPNRDWTPSQELLLELSLASPLNPAFNVHYDFDSGKGLYAQLGVTRAVAPLLSLGTNVYYQNHYYDMTGVPSIELKASSQLAFGPITLTPALSYFMTGANGDFRDAALPARSWLLAVNMAQKLH